MTGKYTNNPDGDIRGRRVVQWFRENVFCLTLPIKCDTCLDVGCGSGRLNQFLKEYCGMIYCIDPAYEKLHESFQYDNVIFKQKSFEELKTKKRFDLISFLLSFYSFEDKKMILKKCYSLLNNSGKILIVDGSESIRLEYILENLSKCVEELGMKISFVEEVDKYKISTHVIIIEKNEVVN